MSGLAAIAALALIPILPAVHSVFVVLALFGSALLAALVGLRHRSIWPSLLHALWRQKWGLISLGLTIGAGAATCAWILEGLPSAPDERSVVVGDWPARGGKSRRAVHARSLSPTSAGVHWTGGVGDTFFASPAVVGNQVVGVGFRRDRGRVYCWDAESGKQLWTARPPGFRATFSSPVIAGNMLLIGEGLHHTTNASVFCLDLRVGREGKVLWSFETNSHVECTPSVDNDRVYVAAGDDGVYCLALSPDVDDSQRVLWHAPGDRYPDVETCLAEHDGRVYVGLGQGGEALVVLDAADGNELARLAMPYPVHGLPALADGRLYLGMGTGDYVDHGQTRGLVVCVDLSTPSIAWTYNVPSTVLDAVVFDSGEVFFGSADGRVSVLNDEGALLQEWNSHAGIVSAPAVTDDMIYVVNEGGVAYGLDRHRLEPVWQSRLGPPGQYVSSPVVAHGHIYVGAGQEGFVCVGHPAETIRPGSNGLPEQGEMLWSHLFEGQLTGPPGLTPSAIVVGVKANDELSLISLANHGISPPREVASFSAAHASRLSVSTVDEIVMVATGSDLVALDAPSLQVLWRVAETTRSEPVIHGGTVWTEVLTDSDASSSTWTLRSLIDGSLLDNSKVPPELPSKNGLEVDGRRIIRRSPGDGPPVVWADCSSLNDILTRPIIHNRRVYIVTADRLVCLGEADHP